MAAKRTTKATKNNAIRVEVGGLVVFDTACRVAEPKSPGITEAAELLPYLEEIRHGAQEVFVCFSLNSAHRILQSRVVTIGLLDQSQVHPREVFAPVLVDRAAAVIFAHNHPSGTLEASCEDRALTERLIKCGELLGIRVLDHVIVTANGYLSMKEAGAIGF